MSINLTEIINVCVANIEAWLPTVTAVVSALICCIWGVARLKKAANDLKSDKTIKEMREEIMNDHNENKEVHRLIQRYLDENHKIKRVDNEESGENRR